MTHSQPSTVAPDIQEQSLEEEFAMLVTFHAKPEYQDALEKMLQEDVKQARKEEGNLSMYLYQAKEDTNTYFIFERWKHQRALDAHFEKPYTKAVLALSEEALTAPMDILFLHDLTPLSPVHYNRDPKDPKEAVELVVVFTVKEGERERFIRQFEYSVQNSRPEAGCVAFHIHSVKDKPNTFVLYERWESQSDLDAHFEQPYTKTLFSIFEEVLEKPLEEGLTFTTFIG